MKLFEYEAKAILKKRGVAIPEGAIAQTPDSAFSIASTLNRAVFVKSQITVAGRGKAGGILEAAGPAEARQASLNLLDHIIKDCRVKSVLVEEKLSVERLFYLSVAIDRAARRFALLASASGGGDIEEIARTTPEKIVRYYIDPASGIDEAIAFKAIENLAIKTQEREKIAAIIVALYRTALEYDAELVELNPLIQTPTGEFIAADARITLDDNALFRHPEFSEKNLQREEDTPREAAARQQKYFYVDLDGDIGIIGNGA
jgi:succinyl-CoA synthetase beta subunit